MARDRRLLGLASLIWLFAFFLAPEALAAPYAHQIGAGEAAVGVLMAANVVGAVIGALVVARIRPDLRPRLTVPLAVATGIPLLVTATGAALPVTVVLWAASGVLSSYLMLAQVSFTQLVPDNLRARAIGLASAGLQTAQGMGVLVAGGLAELMPPSVAIAVCAATGSLGAVVISAVCRLRTDPAAPPPTEVPDAAPADDVSGYADASVAPGDAPRGRQSQRHPQVDY
jgi:MFS family permease